MIEYIEFTARLSRLKNSIEFSCPTSTDFISRSFSLSFGFSLVAAACGFCVLLVIGFCVVVVDVVVVVDGASVKSLNLSKFKCGWSVTFSLLAGRRVVVVVVVTRALCVGGGAVDMLVVVGTLVVVGVVASRVGSLGVGFGVVVVELAPLVDFDSIRWRSCVK